MKFRIRDALTLTMIIALGLAWFSYAQRQASYSQILQQRVKDAAARVTIANAETARWARSAEEINRECQSLAEEVQRLREVIKTSIADRREWFEIEVAGKRLIAVRPGTTSSPDVTLRTIEQIEAATGLEFSKRLKHFMTPISELQLEPR